MLRTMWVRVTGSTVYVFPVRMTRSQLVDAQYQAGYFRGTGIKGTTAYAYQGAGRVNLGLFDTRLEAIAAILRLHQIVPSPESVGIQ